MIALYLLCAHLVGDYLLQSRRMASLKLVDWRVRLQHVYCYCTPFVAVAAWALWPERDTAEGAWRLAAFILCLGLLHFLTDSRRFRSSLMDWIEWYFAAERIRDRFGVRTKLRRRLDASPWPPLSLLVDQTLHLCQIAVLAGVFLA